MRRSFDGDIVLYGTSRFHVQRALHTLDDYVRNLGLQINLKKTKAMKFRKGGKLARDDTSEIGEHELKFVNRFTYLELNARLFFLLTWQTESRRP